MGFVLLLKAAVTNNSQDSIWRMKDGKQLCVSVYQIVQQWGDFCLVGIWYLNC